MSHKSDYNTDKLSYGLAEHVIEKETLFEVQRCKNFE